MGIYISGVKGLPEQVQENKENIKDIQEEIEGIDWDAIHNLENQVAENTQDINNMEGTIGTQNIAITQLGGRTEDLEDKTQDISRQGSMLYIDTGSVVLNARLGFEDDSGAYIELGPNNKIEMNINNQTSIGFNSVEEVEIKSDGVKYEFTNNTIEVNGTPIGKTLYMHDIYINIKDSANFTTFWLMLKIINGSNVAFTFDSLKAYIEDGTKIQVSGASYSSNATSLPVYLGRDGSNYRVYQLNIGNTGLSQAILGSSATSFNDYIREIS